MTFSTNLLAGLPWGLSLCFNLAPRAGLPAVSIANGLDWQTLARGNFDHQRLFGALANRMAEVWARQWRVAWNGNKRRQWVMIRRRKRRAIALGRRAFESGSRNPDPRFEGDS